MPPTESAESERIAAVRAFNRFYTRRVGALHEGLLRTHFTLAESRLLWELAHHEGSTAATLARELELDAGYLSRLLHGLQARGLIKRSRSTEDARHVHLALSAAGRRAFAPLDSRAQADVAGLLAHLPEAQQQDLLKAMATLRQLLGDAEPRKVPYLLRAHRPGDMGWVVSCHGALYAREYGLDLHFEALVARLAADFVDRFDSTHEACWIAERDGANVGCVFLVQARDETTQQPRDGVAQLRMLLVEPAARGLGIGARLVAECERFARHVGYQRIVLWTNSVLVGARETYRQAGYRQVGSETHHSFGRDLVGETWECLLK